MVLSVDFIYSRGSNLATLVNLNQPLATAAGNNALGALPHPNFGFIDSSSTKAAGPVGRVVRDLLLPIVFRYLVTEKSQEWIDQHHIDYATPIEA